MQSTRAYIAALSPHLRHAIQAFVQALGLRVHTFTAEHGVALEIPAGADSRWTTLLSSEDASLLNVWRSGAVRTPTRRHHVRNPALRHFPHCQCPSASARQFFAECPRCHEPQVFNSSRGMAYRLTNGRCNRGSPPTGAWSSLTQTKALTTEPGAKSRQCTCPCDS